MSNTRIYSVGREPSCNIVINDESDTVSRQHCMIKVVGNKRYITDFSTNGTYRNGMRLEPNVEYSFTKDDDIILGGVFPLAWDDIPSESNTGKIVLISSLCAIAVAVLALVVILLVKKCNKSEAIQEMDVVEQTESVQQPEMTETLQPQEKKDEASTEDKTVKKEKAKKTTSKKAKTAKPEPKTEETPASESQTVADESSTENGAGAPDTNTIPII